MIEVLRDSNENICAVCEWNIIGDDGRICDDGRYLLIGDVEINKDLRGKGLLKKMIFRLRDMLGGRNIERVVFVRGYKYPYRKPSVYSAKRFGG